MKRIIKFFCFMLIAVLIVGGVKFYHDKLNGTPISKYVKKKVLSQVTDIAKDNGVEIPEKIGNVDLQEDILNNLTTTEMYNLYKLYSKEFKNLTEEDNQFLLGLYNKYPKIKEVLENPESLESLKKQANIDIKLPNLNTDLSPSDIESLEGLNMENLEDMPNIDPANLNIEDLNSDDENVSLTDLYNSVKKYISQD